MLKRTEYTTDIPDIDESFEEHKTSINQPTGNFFYDPWIVKPEYQGTIWEKLLKSLPLAHGEARLIVMEPGTTYMAHADIDDRWHLNLTGQNSYLIDLDQNEMHKIDRDGHWYSMDAGRIHVASNFGSIDRIQLVVRQLLKSTPIVDLVEIMIEPSYYQPDYRYKFDNFVSPILNRLNKQNLMKDFEFSGEIVKFKTVLSEIVKFKLSSDFNVTVNHS